MKQSWVAYQMGISQATVSRVIQRYERWKAHADPREGGGLDPAERARAQRWLTYERNEIVIASALRLAGEMEGFTDVSTSVTTHPLHDPAQESQVRRESKVIDRHGLAARFLRIAHRVNMDQQKFVELEPLPKPEPLSEADIAREAAEAAADREEKRQHLVAAETHSSQCRRKDVEVLGDAEALRQFDEECAAEAARTTAKHEAQRAAEEAAQWAEEKVEDAPRLAVVGSAGPAEPESAEEGTFRFAGSPQVEPSDSPSTEYSVLSTCDKGSQAQTLGESDHGRGQETRAERAGMHKVHKMHTPSGEKITASAHATSGWIENAGNKDFCEPGCINPAKARKAGRGSSSGKGPKRRPREVALARGSPLE
jgi:hypothetical protein